MGWKDSVYIAGDEDGLYFMGTKEKTYGFSLKGFILGEEKRTNTTTKSLSKNLLEIAQYKSWGQYAAAILPGTGQLSWGKKPAWKCYRKPQHLDTLPWADHAAEGF